MTWTLVLDLAMALLLAASIATGITMNRRLAGLRADRAELETLAENFREATRRADDGIAGLKVSAQALQERIGEAQGLADDLQFLIERGGGLADRLETGVRALRRNEVRSRETPAEPAIVPAAEALSKPRLAAAGKNDDAGARARPKAHPAAAEPRSEAERHLLAALRGRG
jgi:Domain of unknown function (DUF6468)